LGRLVHDPKSTSNTQCAKLDAQKFEGARAANTLAGEWDVSSQLKRFSKKFLAN
jgi:hypothetical protein